MAPQSILVTGCTVGSMGYYLAKSFAKRGLHVFATARATTQMGDLADAQNITLLALDITSPDQISAAATEVNKETGGKLDFLLNNAGRNYLMPTLDVNIDDAMKVFDVNFWGPLRMIQTFSPMLLAAKGTVVNIGSTAGIVGTPFLGPYDASKAAIHCLGQALAAELKPFGVRVLTVVVGAVETDHKEKTALQLPRQSKYLPIEEALSERFTAAKGIKLMDAGAYAEQVTDDVLRGTTGKVWRGSYALMIRIIEALLPQGTMNKIFLKGLGMEKLGN